jgi:hypothetical protein
MFTGAWFYSVRTNEARAVHHAEEMVKGVRTCCGTDVWFSSSNSSD